MNVLPRREVPVSAVEGARNMPKHAHLRRGEQSIGNSDSQHGGMTLDIKTIHQSQGAILIFSQLTCKEAARLLSELGGALVNNRLVVMIVLVHVLWLRLLVVPDDRPIYTFEIRAKTLGRVSFHP